MATCGSLDTLISLSRCLLPAATGNIAGKAAKETLICVLLIVHWPAHGWSSLLSMIRPFLLSGPVGLSFCSIIGLASRLFDLRSHSRVPALDNVTFQKGFYLDERALSSLDLYQNGYICLWDSVDHTGKSTKLSPRSYYTLCSLSFYQVANNDSSSTVAHDRARR